MSGAANGPRPRPFRRGLVLGKFLPPHLGHVHLARVAQSFTEGLDVVVESIAGEDIAQALRVEWMRELVPGANVIALPGHHPQSPAEHPRFWEHWREVLLAAVGSPPDALFASESYGVPLARALGCTFMPVDPPREGVPISATRVREAPLRSFALLPAPVRAHYALRVAVLGPESTGKTTLARALAARFDGVFVPEYARAYLEARASAQSAVAPAAAALSLDPFTPDPVIADPFTPADFERIALGQAASEDSLARVSSGLVMADTDALTTGVWCERLLGAAPPWLVEFGASRRYDLTFLLAPDVPWVADPVRYLPGEGQSFFDRLAAALRRANREPVVLTGTFDERTETAAAHVQQLRDAAFGAGGH